MDEKMGYVKRTPLGALKKLCEEYSLSRNIGGLLRKFENLVYLAIDKMKNKDNKSMFTKNTQYKVLGKDERNSEDLGEEMLDALKDEDNGEIIM